MAPMNRSAALSAAAQKLNKPQQIQGRDVTTQNGQTGITGAHGGFQPLGQAAQAKLRGFSGAAGPVSPSAPNTLHGLNPAATGTPPIMDPAQKPGGRDPMTGGVAVPPGGGLQVFDPMTHQPTPTPDVLAQLSGAMGGMDTGATGASQQGPGGGGQAYRNAVAGQSMPSSGSAPGAAPGSQPPPIPPNEGGGNAFRDAVSGSAPAGAGNWNLSEQPTPAGGSGPMPLLRGFGGGPLPIKPMPMGAAQPSGGSIWNRIAGGGGGGFTPQRLLQRNNMASY